MQAFKIVADTDTPESVGAVVNVNTVILSDSYFSEILDEADCAGRIAKAKALAAEHECSALDMSRMTFTAVACEIEPLDA